MSTSSTNRFLRQVTTTTISSLPASTTNYFSITGGPVQLLHIIGFIEETVAGSGYGFYVELTNGHETAGFSPNLTLTGETAGTMIDFVNPFFTPTTGNPVINTEGRRLSYASTGSLRVEPTGTPGAGTITLCIHWVPMSLEAKVQAI